MDAITENAKDVANMVLDPHNNVNIQNTANINNNDYTSAFVIILSYIMMFTYMYITVRTIYDDYNEEKQNESIYDYNENMDQDSDEDQPYDYNLGSCNNEKTIRWKKREWRRWMNRLEQDWEAFNIEMNNEKDEWIKKKEKDWDLFLIELENKWNHYNKHLDDEFDTNIISKYSSWVPKEWIDWMKADGIRFIYMEWKKWVLESHNEFSDKFVDKWMKWKKNKILSWSKLDWKRKESQKWDKFEQKRFKRLYYLDNKRYNEFINRKKDEQSQWNDWVKTKDNEFVENVLNEYLLWKDGKHILYKEWVENFVTKWINQKQWNVWIEDQHALPLKNDSEKSTEQEKIQLVSLLFDK
ncbi:tryptophan-rich protein tryptophan-rich antigen [Plasmodium vinckei brucechwatti]|uniref:Tryptophan-rich protein tryptophan-rich antigen n=1 Tax=Plasmodium vinckei brucechwatti TaxID=119398 RepID=A0A6V7RZC8_PLAVN|nr:tryptophan-rich protein tryptophan-rich antigen [Plasmodium vinckei brucechwatti]